MRIVEIKYTFARRTYVEGDEAREFQSYLRFKTPHEAYEAMRDAALRWANSQPRFKMTEWENEITLYWENEQGTHFIYWTYEIRQVQY